MRHTILGMNKLILPKQRKPLKAIQNLKKYISILYLYPQKCKYNNIWTDKRQKSLSNEIYFWNTYLEIGKLDAKRTFN